MRCGLVSRTSLHHFPWVLPAVSSRSSEITSASASTEFPETAWSTIRRAGHDSEEQRTIALRQLCERYEPAIRRSLVRMAGPGLEVDDLVQGFLAEKFLRPQFLANVQADGGRFRDFIRICLRNYVRTAWRRSVQASDRGQSPDEQTEPVSAEPGPDAVLDQEWARQILELARGRLRAEAAAAGLEELCDHLEARLDGGTDLPGQEELGRRLGKSGNAVAVALHRLRERYAWLLHDEIRRTVADPTRWKEERDHLVAILSAPRSP